MEKKIVRRSLVEHRSPYREYKDILREDFTEIMAKALSIRHGRLTGNMVEKSGMWKF